jgi:hypothetical protein
MNTSHKLNRTEEGNLSAGEMVCSLKTFRYLQIVFAAVTHLDERLSLETLVTLKQKPLICLAHTRPPTTSVTEQLLILSTWLYSPLLDLDGFFIFLTYTQ